jgi:putative transcriptional regulator
VAGWLAKQIIDGLNEFSEAIERDALDPKRFTCRTVELNVEPSKYSAKMVRATRQLLRASQAVFAQFLGVSVKTVRSWEQGINTPKDVAARFLDEIRRNPDYWRARIRESIVVK